MNSLFSESKEKETNIEDRTEFTVFDKKILRDLTYLRGIVTMMLDTFVFEPICVAAGIIKVYIEIDANRNAEIFTIFSVGSNF